MVDSALKWHGGKGYLAARLWEIASKIPHVHRVEVYGGSLAFTLASEPKGYSEVVNDLNPDLMVFWQVMAHRDLFEEFRRTCEATPFSERAWVGAERLMSEPVAVKGVSSEVSKAWAFFVFCRQSMAGRMKNFAPLSKNRTRRGMNEQASAWLSAVEGLPAVHERLIRVAIRNKPALEIIKSEDSPNTLFYMDPPYVHSTRSTTKEYGDHEMSEEQHIDLLNTLADIEGKFLLSGYRSELYDNMASGNAWKRIDFDLPNNAASGKTKERKTECVWIKNN